MKSSFHPELRALLRQHQGGKTTTQLAALTGRTSNAIRKALEVMPDAYISGWVQMYKTPMMAVWSVVVPPPHAPKPDAVPKRTRRRPEDS